MCKDIVSTTAIRGSGRSTSGWFSIQQASVGYDHPVHAPIEHAFLLDFGNPSLGPDARVAVELDHASAQALHAALAATLRKAELAGIDE